MKLPDSQIRYVDIPELSETFADSVKLSTFDGSVTIVELCVTRLQDPKPTKKPEAKRVPVCRLVLTPDATVDLHRQLQNMIEGMIQSGVLKQVPIQETTGTNH